MSKTIQWKEVNMKQKNFIKDLTHIKQTEDTITRVIGAGLSTSVP